MDIASFFACCVCIVYYVIFLDKLENINDNISLLVEYLYKGDGNV